MRKFFTDFFRSAAEVVMLSLILCVLTVIFLPAPLCYTFVLTLPIYSFLGVCIQRALRRRPFLQYLFCAAAALGGTWLTLRLHGLPGLGGGIFMLLASGAACVRGRVLASRLWDEVAPVYLYTMIMAFNLVFTLLAGVIPVLAPFRPVATVLGPFIVVIGLLTMNSLHLFSLTSVQHGAGMAGHMSSSRVMGRQNRILLLIIFALTLLISSISWILTAVKWLFLRLAELIMWFINVMVPSGGSGDGGGGSGIPEELLGDTQKVPNPFWEALEQFLIHGIAILATVALGIALLWALYKGLKALIRLLRALAAHFASLRTDADEYTDTREALIDLKDLPKHYLDRAKAWLEDKFWREPPWSAFKTVPEQVRHLYRRAVYGAMAQGYKYKSSRTPGETLRDAAPHSKSDPGDLQTLRGYYEQVRYGTKEPDAADVEDLNQRIK